MPRVKLFGYLGVTESGDLGLYVSPQELNVIGARLEKGNKFPHSVYNFVDTPGDQTAVAALIGLQDYFDGKDSRSTLTFGEKIRKKKR